MSTPYELKCLKRKTGADSRAGFSVNHWLISDDQLKIRLSPVSRATLLLNDRDGSAGTGAPDPA
jgi:hypothetical protein